MSKMLETGFTVKYQIDTFRSIKVTPSGDMNGTKYGASVKIKAVNVTQEEDEKFGLVEKESIMEFRIPSPDADLRNFNLFLRGLQKKNIPLVLSGTVPRDAGKDTHTVTSLETAPEIMARMQPKEAKASTNS